ncbi:MAG: hydrogenase maturation nickel metallochaperone HypA [Gammaproteobacteria bacterium]|nr:hydrogenase maturation nickel metallochaperone HypA [Gammaproteobacteria bacterium]
MHELALARSLIEMIDDYALAHGARQVTRVHVRLGVLSALTRALYVSFRAASRGTRCEGATLDIEEVPLTVYCRFCDAAKTPSGPWNFRCPECGHATHEVVTGREMQLVSIVLGDDTHARDGGHPPPVSIAASGPASPAGDPGDGVRHGRSPGRRSEMVDAAPSTAPGPGPGSPQRPGVLATHLG